MTDLPPPPASGFGPVVTEDVLLRRLVIGVVPGVVRRGVLAGRVEVQLGAAHAGHQRVAVGPRGHRERVVRRLVQADVGGAAVTGRGEHRDVVRVRVRVGAAQGQQGGPGRERLLGRAEALADHVAETVVDHVVLGRDDLREPGHALGLRHRRLDQQDVRARRDGVRVLDVEGGLPGPAHHVGVVRVVGRDLSGRLNDVQRGGRGEVERLVKDVQVMADRRRAERVHDHDRRFVPVHPVHEKGRQVVGLLDLVRLVTGDLVVRLAVRGRGRGTARAPGLRDAGPDDDVGAGRGRLGACHRDRRPRGHHGGGGERAGSCGYRHGSRQAHGNPPGNKTSMASPAQAP